MTDKGAAAIELLKTIRKSATAASSANRLTKYWGSDEHRDSPDQSNRYHL